MTDIEVDIRQEVILNTRDGEHELFCHIVQAMRKGDDIQAIILEASIYGHPLTALCGKQWVPQRDPSKYPKCPTCKEVYKQRTGKEWS